MSVVGYKFVTPFLERAVGLRDTCGILNLHGMPGVLGGIVSAIAAGAANESSYHGTYGGVFLDSKRSHSSQAGFQMASLAVTLAIALVGGAFTGFVISLAPSLPTFFEDSHEYHVPDMEHGGDEADRPDHEHTQHKEMAPICPHAVIVTSSNEPLA